MGNSAKTPIMQPAEIPDYLSGQPNVSTYSAAAYMHLRHHETNVFIVNTTNLNIMYAEDLPSGCLQDYGRTER